MLIPNQIVQVRWNNTNRQHYESKGYVYHHKRELFDVRAQDLMRGCSVRVNVICDYCGQQYDTIFAQYIKGIQRNGKNACSHCAGLKTKELSLQRRAAKSIAQARRICDEKGYQLVTTIDDFERTTDLVEFICPKHGLQKIIFDGFLHGHGCYFCGREQVGDTLRKSDDYVRDIINSYNNNVWLNEGEYKSDRIRNLKIKCGLCGEIFETSLCNYQKHDVRMCPSCSKKRSHGQRRIKDILQCYNIQFEQQKRFKDCRDNKPMPFDFYLPEYNTIIEYDGEQHFEPVFGDKSYMQTAKHDKQKNTYCKNKGINIIRIPYHQKDNLEDIIINALNLQVEDIV